MPWSVWSSMLSSYFFGGGGGAGVKFFHSFWAESIVRWGENRRSPRKTIWPPTSRTWLVSHMTRARSNPQHKDDKWFRALKISVLSHSATGAAHPRSLISEPRSLIVFTRCSMGSWTQTFCWQTLKTDQRLSDRGLCWVHRCCWFFHALVNLFFNKGN